MDDKKTQIISETADKILGFLAPNGKTDVGYDKENDVYNVQIETEDAGILIGKRGETLNSLQLVLNQIVYTKTKENTRIVVNIGDWRQKREEVLKKLAETAVFKVHETGEPQHIWDLTNTERRFLHIFLSDDATVTTESEGEGRDRHLVVKPKTS